MDDSPPTRPDLVSSHQPKEDTQVSRKRTATQKAVVTVKIETNDAGKQKCEGPPSDFWSWRKYGQKPIKGSPYPRGYYRCSTSKGCSAKKQVERCRTDPSVLVITYTSDHNHPDPDPPITTPPTAASPHSRPTNQQGVPTTDSTKQPTKTCAPACEEDSTSAETGDQELQSPPECPMEGAQTEKSHCPLGTVLEEGGALPHTNIKNSSEEATQSSEDNFFDELEELPVSSSFTGWVRSSSFDDRVLPLLPIPLLDY